jgi:hypothetical protein
LQGFLLERRIRQRTYSDGQQFQHIGPFQYSSPPNTNKFSSVRFLNGIGISYSKEMEIGRLEMHQIFGKLG